MSSPKCSARASAVRDLQDGGAEFARTLRIELEVEMLENEILFLGGRANEQVDVGEQQRAPGRPGTICSRSSGGGIFGFNEALAGSRMIRRRADLGVLQHLGRAAPHQSHRL